VELSAWGPDRVTSLSDAIGGSIKNQQRYTV